LCRTRLETASRKASGHRQPQAELVLGVISTDGAIDELVIFTHFDDRARGAWHRDPRAFDDRLQESVYFTYSSDNRSVGIEDASGLFVPMRHAAP
jgi:hypothetical protein